MSDRIVLNVPIGRAGETFRVRAKRINKWFAVHHTVRDGGQKFFLESRNWTVTHIPTALAVTKYLMNNRTAIKLANELAALPFPWHVETAKAYARAAGSKKYRAVAGQIKELARKATV
jgi:hypothetical protein